MSNEIAYRNKASRFMELAQEAASLDERAHLIKFAMAWADLADLAKDEVRDSIRRHRLLNVRIEDQ